MNQSKIHGNDICNARLARRAKVAMSLLAAAPLAGSLIASAVAGKTVLCGILAGLVGAFSVVVVASLRKR